MQRGGLAVGDGSWNLAVFVTDLQVERTLRVRGDVHIGGLMIRLVDELGRKKRRNVGPLSLVRPCGEWGRSSSPYSTGSGWR